MARHITVIQGHPHMAKEHLDHALAAAYIKGALESGHEVKTIDVAALEFPIIRSQEEWSLQPAPAAIQQAQEKIQWAHHLLIIYPLWMGSMPALLKAFLEQVLRPGFAYRERKDGFPEKLLKGKSCRIIVTMGMPAFIYRWYFRAHSVKSLKRNMLGMCGIGPIRTSMFGMVENSKRREEWFKALRALGRSAR